MKKGDIIYKDRLLALDLLPLTYDREMKDLTFFFKLLHGYYDLNVSDYVSFVSHCRTRNCEILLLCLKFRRVKQVLFSRPSLIVRPSLELCV